MMRVVKSKNGSIFKIDDVSCTQYYWKANKWSQRMLSKVSDDEAWFTCDAKIDVCLLGSCTMIMHGDNVEWVKM